jgi:hypothetical protein
MSPETWREWFRDLDPDVRIRFRRTDRLPIEYAVTLEVLTGSTWTVVRLWDNAHGLDLHHEHAYTRTEGKVPPTVRRYPSVNEAMATAIRTAAVQWQSIVRQWREA